MTNMWFTEAVSILRKSKTVLNFKTYSTTKAKKQEMTEADLRLVMEKTEVVTDHERCAKILNEIQNSPDLIVGFDCEGRNLGPTGLITLTQIGLPDGRAFIFDVLQGPRLFTLGGLQAFLESKSVLKVIHDCRGDSVNLRKQFGVQLKNVFDTAAAYTVLHVQKTGEPPFRMIHTSLQNICQQFNSRFPIAKKDKSIYQGNQQYWERRPLTEKMIIYAALDVLCLVPEVYESMERSILPELNFLVEELSIEQSLMNNDDLLYEYKQKLKTLHKAELKKLEVKINGAIEAQKQIEISYREIALLRHIFFPSRIRSSLMKYYRPKLNQ